MLSRPESRLTEDTRRKLRQLLVAVCFVALHVLLDRSTMFFQIWTEISAWYPPTGLAFAVLIGFGPRYALPILLAADIASIVNYDQPVYSFSFLVGNIEFTLVLTAAALLLRRAVKIDLHHHLLHNRRNAVAIQADPSEQLAFRVFAFLTRYPGLVNLLARISRPRLPLTRMVEHILPAPIKGWISSRELPSIARESFRDYWRKR